MGLFTANPLRVNLLNGQLMQSSNIRNLDLPQPQRATLLPQPCGTQFGSTLANVGRDIMKYETSSKMTSTSCDYEVPYHSRLVAKCCKYTHTGFWMMPLIELSQDTAPPTINPQNAMPSKIYIDTIINMCHQTTNVGNT